MPLVIAVLLFVFLWTVSRENLKNSNKKSSTEAKMQKTNAELECNLVNECLLQGMLFDEAYETAQKQIASKGYVPCIPKVAYKNPKSIKENLESSFCNYYKYDSEVVRNRKEAFSRINGGKPSDEEIYDDFPFYEIDLSRESARNHAALCASLLKKGDVIRHNRYGICEVLGHKFSPNKVYVKFILRVVSTGETVYMEQEDKEYEKVR